eukprot:CAMPEP_0119485602 /NCGR_PEP_ID=MMETSP1344-20130328/12261_1 /TAXON_ID=236787 /ORGANISM="Florenciella parvula, Strain CCMP2471" /LENGTH=263 /DNA_ID=CAMNT_0007520289 /DNA_START=1 /DNA_END=788 /DNA_ORIENTATION=-
MHGHAHSDLALVAEIFIKQTAHVDTLLLRTEGGVRHEDEKDRRAADKALLHQLVFQNTALAQKSLEILQSLHCLKETTLNDLKQIQLIDSALVKADPGLSVRNGEGPRGDRSVSEQLIRRLRRILKYLKDDAETSELWAELRTEKGEQAVQKKLERRHTRPLNKNERRLARVCKDLQTLTNSIIIVRPSLQPARQTRFNTEVQDILRNLGAFESIMALLEEISEMFRADADAVDDTHDFDYQKALLGARKVQYLGNCFLVAFA